MPSKFTKAAKGGNRATLLPEIKDIKMQLVEIREDVKLLVKIEETEKGSSSKRDNMERQLYVRTATNL